MTTQETAQAIFDEIHKVIVGQDEVLELLTVAYFCGGHVLFEGVPGLAKTLIVKAFALITGRDFKRIQFTPDLLPSDIVGTNVFNLKESAFLLRKGPIFTSFLLADEINRTPPKTQSALLEAMEEHRVTIDGDPYALSDDFTVVATQNPIEYEGTYPLPEAQLDRFIFKVLVDYPSEAEEKQILVKFHEGFDPHKLVEAGLRTVMTESAISGIRADVQKITVEESILDYINKIVRATRTHPAISLGASPRASIGLLVGSKALAAVRGKRYITPDEVVTLAKPVCRHRFHLTPEAEIEGDSVDVVIDDIVASVPVPR
jgi:MoxR-like ATPase